uniref:NmrA family NAD(P)-binding protein n=1 Tax=Trichocoleus desertorum TaxID=1481672 RepID=UPI0025B4A799|nr:NmrA family NAD(P)-binding protein [Trichocoleus desertorum]
MNNSGSSASEVESRVGKVLLIGVTGGTGHRVVQGLLEQKITDLRILTRKIDLNRPSLAKLNHTKLEFVEGDLDDATSLAQVFAGVSQVYCHAIAGDSAKPDPREVSRARTLAQVAKTTDICHFIYNSAGGADRQTGIGHIEQKYQVEQILRQAGLPTTMLRACLFMEEFWKRYTRPSVLKGSFSFSVQPNRPLHLITTKDMGRVAAQVMKHPERYLEQSIELAGDVLTPRQMAEVFTQVQGKPVIYREVPPWIFLLLFRKSLFDLIQWYRNQGYQADVPNLRKEFPGLLTTFQEFLEESHWSDETLMMPL